MGLIQTQEVTVWRREQTGTDGFRQPVYGEWKPETVSGCLVTPGTTEDLAETRPEGVRVTCTLHLPKTYAAPMQGCEVTIGTARYRVVGGDLPPYMPENTPGTLNRPVMLEAVDG
ncbi:MAG: hypothetical protein SO366_02840 [Atopobiaceae bacterium]|nr:hypothetical protein [Atopobiaceae bacterium]